MRKRNISVSAAKVTLYGPASALLHLPPRQILITEMRMDEQDSHSALISERTTHFMMVNGSSGQRLDTTSV